MFAIFSPTRQSRLPLETICNRNAKTNLPKNGDLGGPPGLEGQPATMTLEKNDQKGLNTIFFITKGFKNGPKRGKMGAVLKMFFFFSFTKKPFFAKPTIEEVLIFGVSEVPTVPVEEVKKFLKHIDKDMKACLFLTQLEKVFIFRYRHFFVSLGGGGPELTF